MFLYLNTGEFYGGCKFPAAAFLLSDGSFFLSARRWCAVRPTCSVTQLKRVIVIFIYYFIYCGPFPRTDVWSKEKNTGMLLTLQAFLLTVLFLYCDSVSSSVSVSWFGVLSLVSFCFIFSPPCPVFMAPCRRHTVFTSMWVIDQTSPGGFMFSGCLSISANPVNAVSQERLEEIS